MRHFLSRILPIAAVQACIVTGATGGADDPKPTPANTISIHVTAPVKPQTFARPIKFRRAGRIE